MAKVIWPEGSVPRTFDGDAEFIIPGKCGSHGACPQVSFLENGDVLFGDSEFPEATFRIAAENWPATLACLKGQAAALGLS